MRETMEKRFWCAACNKAHWPSEGTERCLLAPPPQQPLVAHDAQPVERFVWNKHGRLDGSPGLSVGDALVRYTDHAALEARVEVLRAENMRLSDEAYESSKRLAEADARLSALQKEHEQIKLQMLSVLVRDLGYTYRPAHGHKPLRHQFAWDWATAGMTPEDVASEVESSQASERKERAAIAATHPDPDYGF